MMTLLKSFGTSSQPMLMSELVILARLDETRERFVALRFHLRHMRAQPVALRLHLRQLRAQRLHLRLHLRH